MADRNEHLKFAQEYVHATVRGLSLINGGAIVALYTILSEIGAGADRYLVWSAFVVFAVGLAFAVSASVAGYFFHANEMNQNTEASSRWENVGIGFVALSLIAFLLGAGLALGGVLTTNCPVPRV